MPVPLCPTLCRHAFYACGAVVRVVATETGEQLHQLVGHTDDVTGVQLHPNNAKCVVTCSLDGTRTLCAGGAHACIASC